MRSVPVTNAGSRSGLDEDELRGLVFALEPELRRLEGCSVLITGATGWFGVWLLDVLCSANDRYGLAIRITAVSRNPELFLNRFQGFARCGITWLKSDVRNLSVPGRFSYVIHAANDTVASATPSALLQVFETIVDGTRQVIEAVDDTCKGFLLVSSGAVYGPARSDRQKFAEVDDGGPDPSVVRSAYAEGKRAAEMLAALGCARGIPVRIARCFAFVGPHMPFNKRFAIGNFIADAVADRLIRIRSDGHALRSYLYMTDLIRALLMVLTRGSVGKAYNVGSEVAVSIGQLARQVHSLVGGRGVLIEGAASDPSDRYVPDMSRLRQDLGYVPEVDLAGAISRTAAWYRATY